MFNPQLFEINNCDRKISATENEIAMRGTIPKLLMLKFKYKDRLETFFVILKNSSLLFLFVLTKA